MEDDKQNDRPQRDEEDDEEEGGEHVEILMHAAYADDGAAFMEASVDVLAAKGRFGFVPIYLSGNDCAQLSAATIMLNCRACFTLIDLKS